MKRFLTLLPLVFSSGCASPKQQQYVPDSGRFVHPRPAQSIPTGETPSEGGTTPVSTTATWPKGADGDLVVPAGETFIALIDRPYDFRNVTIHGTVELQDGDGWLILGVAGDFLNKGQIVARKGQAPVLAKPSEPSTTITATAPDGTPLEYITGCGRGGSGGIAGKGYATALGGDKRFGNGGGGAAAANAGEIGQSHRGGNGASGPLHGGKFSGRGGLGGVTFGADGKPGQALETDYTTSVFAGGGGGGMRGLAGQGVYINARGTFDSLGGTIDVSGHNGGKGGDGGLAKCASGPPYGGAGGGGGGGGFGGKVILHCKTEPRVGIVNVEGGAGGDPGTRGISDQHGRNAGYEGGPGQEGAPGQRGELVILQR